MRGVLANVSQGNRQISLATEDMFIWGQVHTSIPFYFPNREALVDLYRDVVGTPGVRHHLLSHCTMGSTAAGMLGLGLCASAIFITATTLIQHETPHELLGRVMSCMMSLVAGSQVISMFVAGPVAEKIGIPNLYYGSAAMLVGIGVVGYFKLPKAEIAEAEKVKSAETD